MTFEAQIVLSPGRGVTARLIPERNAVEIETAGEVTQPQVDALLPRLLVHLATRAGLPVRYHGATYWPDRNRIVAEPEIWA
jgi:hypothetical protein